MKRLLLILLLLSLSSCDDDNAQDPLPEIKPDPTCTGLYGGPNGATGLDEDACFPRIEGEQSWSAKAWVQADFETLLSWTLEDPPEVLTEDPYELTPELSPNEVAVCAVEVVEAGRYRLVTFAEDALDMSIEAAARAGATITHGGACGACSSLADLEVYARIPDQTDPVRACAADNLDGSVEEIDACIQDAVGFTPPCSRIWAYNSLNDRVHCATPCLLSILNEDPYNMEDGALNECLQCDEDFSGAVFKAVAGRTRRNSGLASAICRPCETVWRLDHIYPQP